MHHRHVALTRDKFFGRKLTLLADRSGVALTVCEQAPTAWDADAYLIDVDTYTGALPEGVPLYRFSRTREDCLPIPTPIDTVESILRGEGESLRLQSDARHASIGNRSIPLTEVEGALLSELLLAKGKCVSADSLIQTVWKGNASHSCVNVYIHYLRQKLESGGERIIRSRRGEGYYVDEKYVKEGALC